MLEYVCVNIFMQIRGRMEERKKCCQQADYAKKCAPIHKWIEQHSYTIHQAPWVHPGQKGENWWHYSAPEKTYGWMYTQLNNILSVSLDLLTDIISFAVSAKFVFDADLHAFDSPTKDTEQFIEGVTLCFDCFGRMLVEPPFYKIYPNKLFRDFRKGIMVRYYLHGWPMKIN